MEADPRPSSWTEEMSDRERVLAVVETLSEPATASEIAQEAEVSRETAKKELNWLEQLNRVQKAETRDGTYKYDLCTAQMFFDELVGLVEEHTEQELKVRLAELVEDREQLQSKFGVESLEDLRTVCANGAPNESYSSKQLRHAASTWQTLNFELEMVQKAIHLYDDVDNLTNSIDLSPEDSI